MPQNWFKHDYNARNDDNILELRSKYGWKGYGLFFAFIELMAANGTGAIDLDKVGGLSIEYNLPKEYLQDFIQDCIDIGLFYKDENGLIRNDRVTNHVEEMELYRRAGKKGANKRWHSNGKSTPNSPPNNDPNAEKTREDKNREYTYGDSSKWDKEQPIDYASFVHAFNDLYDRQLRVTDKKRKMVRARLRTFTGDEIRKSWHNRDKDDWLNGEGSKYKGNWKAAMRNDERVDKYLNEDSGGSSKSLAELHKKGMEQSE